MDDKEILIKYFMGFMEIFFFRGQATADMPFLFIHI